MTQQKLSTEQVAALLVAQRTGFVHSGRYMTRDEVAAVVPPEVLKRFAAGPYACGSVHPAMFGLLFVLAPI